MRCRIRSVGVVIELDDRSMSRLTRQKQEVLKEKINSLFEYRGYEYPVSFERYTLGSAFIHIQPVHAVES